MKHPKSERLSDFLEGDLTPQEARELESHVDGCDRCSHLLRDLRQIQKLARELPELHPPRDLWPEIAAAIQEQEGRGANVIRLYPAAHSSGSTRGRTFRLSVPQAVAAGLALAVFSGVMGARIGQAPSPEVSVGREDPVSWVSIVSEASPELEDQAREVAMLEGVFSRYRDDLDPGTAEILARNLRVIDQAIQESLLALQTDPGNRFLLDHLERAILAKGDYLRDASLLIDPVT